MAKKMVQKKDTIHPDAYRLRCYDDDCERLFEAGNDDFRYIGGDMLSCTCPWCKQENRIRIRALQRAKIKYGPTYKYID